VREGHLKQEVPIISNDEIGDLTNEFNKMIVRLQRFESGTKGKLLEERNKSMAIVKSISDPLIVLDTDFKVLLMNHACEMFFNISERTTINKHFLEVIRINDIFDHIEKVYRSNEDKHIPKIIGLDTEGKNFYFDTIVTKIKNEEGSIIGLVVLFQNVTKLKKLEKAKTEFVSTISHEFKTPLTSIMMGTSLIKNEGLGKLGDKQLEIIRTIEDDTERLSTLVNDLIQLSKIESDRALYHFEPCSIFGIVEHCIKTFSEQVHLKEITLYSEVGENLPKIMVDYEKISWVINNLISNALKYTNAGDYISIHASVKGKTMQISVKDTGMGIPNEYKDIIFDKFVKVNSFHSEQSGTGLGLSIAKEIVIAHKGSIWCESELDEGSTFTFTVPLID
jgi:PAS domain S-box-containing protein